MWRIVNRENRKDKEKKAGKKKEEEERIEERKDTRKIPSVAFFANAAQGTDLYGFPYFTRNTSVASSGGPGAPTPDADVLFRFPRYVVSLSRSTQTRRKGWDHGRDARL